MTDNQNGGDSPDKSETTTNEIEAEVEAAYAAEALLRVRHPEEAHTRDQLRESITAHHSVRAKIRDSALKSLGLTEPPSEDHPLYLVYASKADILRSSGGPQALAQKWARDHGREPSALRQSAALMDRYAEEAAEAGKRGYVGWPIGPRESDFRAWADAYRTEAAETEANRAAQAALEARLKAEAEARAKAERKAKFEELKALMAEFGGSSA